MEQLSLRANAKINLFLDVLERRPDGYHNIHSVFQFVSLRDKLELAKSDHTSFWCNWKALNNEDNLAFRAYRRLAEEYPIGGVEIRLEKRIPIMSGLGGGSADCATVLKGLNQLFELNIPNEKLLAIGAELGADVPACLTGGALLAGGIGEEITPIPQQGRMWLNIIKPQVAFSTAEMYRRLGRDETPCEKADLTDLMEGVASCDPAAVAERLYNCFELVADPIEPIRAARRLLLESGALGAGMSGSGSAVFGLYADEDSARDSYEMILASGSEVYLCHT